MSSPSRDLDRVKDYIKDLEEISIQDATRISKLSMENKKLKRENEALLSEIKSLQEVIEDNK